MKKLLFVLLMGATVNGNITVKSEDWTVANTIATNAAALTDSSGVQLKAGSWLAACVSAPAAQTVTSGSLRAYVQMAVDQTTDGGSFAPPTYRWVAYPALDWTLTASVRDQCSGDKQVGSGIGRFSYVEDNLVLSGGTTIKVTYSMRGNTP